MKYIKKLIKLLSIIIISTLILTIVSYNNLINDDLLRILQFIILFTSIFLISFNLGKAKQKDGYLEGIKFAGIIAILFLILRIIIYRKISILKIIYYLSIITISMIGSILGINKKIKA